MNIEDTSSIPGTSLKEGQTVYFKSIHGDFPINGKPAKIVEWTKHQYETSEFPSGIAICIQFGSEFNRGKTWGRIDEIFPYPDGIVD